MRTWSTPPWTSTPTTQHSGTVLSPTNFLGRASRRARTGPSAYAGTTESVFSKKRSLNRRPGPPVHDDLVERDFTAAAPNELWLTGITEHPAAEGKLYLCAVKDVYSGRIVGYSMDLACCGGTGERGGGTQTCRDRGSQFRSRRFVESLRHHGLSGSMARTNPGALGPAVQPFVAEFVPPHMP